MTRYSVQPRDRIFAKGYGILSFARNMGRNIGKKISKNFAKQSARVSNTSPKNNSETNEEEILRERLISPELRHKVFDDLRLIEENY